ncbi:uncharacterized protein LOC143781535 [Ranitomeya variabilis]|uniref:uncharacterized protein LOC143781535 n=1 Tax=Ranitomeya variabilis TaxID=490064 RepID=UPI004056FF8A
MMMKAFGAAGFYLLPSPRGSRSPYTQSSSSGDLQAAADPRDPSVRELTLTLLLAITARCGESCGGSSKTALNEFWEICSTPLDGQSWHTPGKEGGGWQKSTGKRHSEDITEDIDGPLL